nr:hypothetical protein [uncultured Anaeromusa sp.]
MSVALVLAGGVYHLFFGFFHAAFWKMKLFNWREELPVMSPVNRFVIQGMNIAVITFMFLIAYVSLRHTGELLTTPLGRTILIGTAVFWLVRLIVEFAFKKRGAANSLLVIAFLIGVLLYVLPIALI